MSLTDGSWPYLKTIKIIKMKMGKGEVTTIIMRPIMGMMEVLMIEMIVMMRKQTLIVKTILMMMSAIVMVMTVMMRARRWIAMIMKSQNG